MFKKVIKVVVGNLGSAFAFVSSLMKRNYDVSLAAMGGNTCAWKYFYRFLHLFSKTSTLFCHGCYSTTQRLLTTIGYLKLMSILFIE